MNEERIHHYKALMMVYNILIQSSFLGPCPPPTDLLDTNTLCFRSQLCFHLQARCT